MPLGGPALWICGQASGLPTNPTGPTTTAANPSATNTGQLHVLSTGVHLIMRPWDSVRRRSSGRAEGGRGAKGGLAGAAVNRKIVRFGSRTGLDESRRGVVQIAAWQSLS
jgi:hypothetical protein